MSAWKSPHLFKRDCSWLRCRSCTVNKLRPASASRLLTALVRNAGQNSAHGVKRLILMRHADSETGSNYRDHDRPISAQGKQQAAQTAIKLDALGWIPDLIVASNAKRTRQTLDQMENVVKELGTADVHFLGSLYTVAALDGQTRTHLQGCVLDLVDSSHSCVMCVGHNKGWEEAASSFARQEVRLKTGDAALLQCDSADWESAMGEESDWSLVAVVNP